MQKSRGVMKNFVSLGVLQGLNYLLPLVMLPYLIRILGVEAFGVLSVATVVGTYMSIASEYGFGTTATRAIAHHRDDPHKINEIVSAVMLLRVLIALGVVVMMSLIVWGWERLHPYAWVYYGTFGVVLGSALFPVWFFQGIEKMHTITYLTLLSRGIFALGVVLWVHSPEEVYRVPMFSALGSWVAGVWALWIVRDRWGVRWSSPSLEQLGGYLREGWSLFISNLSVQGYKGNGLLLLGVFASETVVGWFAIVRRVIDALSTLNVILWQAFFPYLIQRPDDRREYLRLLGIAIVMNTLIALMVWMGAEDMVVFLTHHLSSEVIAMLHALALIPLIIGVNIPAMHYLLIHHHDGILAWVLFLGMMVDLMINLLLIPLYAHWGVVIAMIVVEMGMSVVLYLFAIKYSHQESVC